MCSAVTTRVDYLVGSVTFNEQDLRHGVATKTTIHEARRYVFLDPYFDLFDSDARREGYSGL